MCVILPDMMRGRRKSTEAEIAEKPQYEFEAPRVLITLLPAALGFLPLLARGDTPWIAAVVFALIVLVLAWGSATAVVGSTNWYRIGLDERLIALSGAGRNSRVLNPICGTGSLAISFVRTVKPLEVWATDRWTPTKRRADPSRRLRDNIRIEGAEGAVQVRDADPLSLPFKARYFNVVGSRYGISNSRKHKREVLLEMLRVLKPGGRVVLAETLPVALWLRYVVLARLSREYKTADISLSRFHFTAIVAAQKLG